MVRFSRARGFILVDCLVALAMVATGIFTLTLLFRSEARELRTTHERFAAQLAAESEIERLRAVSFDAIPLGARQPLPLALPSMQRLKEARAVLTVSAPAPGVKSALVRVEWSSSTGKPLFTELAGLFTKEAQP